MAKTSQKIRTSFNVWTNSFESAYDKFLAELEGKVEMMRAQGMSDNEILGRLERTLKDEVDVFSGFGGSIEKYADDLTSSIAQSASNDFNLEEKLVWSLDPTAKEHCEDCINNSEESAKTFSEWEAIGLPGVGNTECGQYCKCTLNPEVEL